MGRICILYSKKSNICFLVTNWWNLLHFRMYTKPRRQEVKSFNLYSLACTNYININLICYNYLLHTLSVNHYSEHIKFKMSSMNPRARLDTYILQVSMHLALGQKLQLWCFEICHSYYLTILDYEPYKQIVNEAQTSWLSLVENEGE